MPNAPDPLPDPLTSAWVALLRRHVSLPEQATLGQLRARSDAAVKELKGRGRNREAAELRDLRDDYEKARAKAAWSEAKRLFETHALPERAWRAVKQADCDPEKLLARLRKLGASLAGAGADRVRDALLGSG